MQSHYQCGSVLNNIYQEVVNKLGLVVEVHPKSYQFVWINDDKIAITSTCKVDLYFGRNKSVWCDILAVTIGYILLGQPWLFDRQVIHYEYA